MPIRAEMSPLKANMENMLQINMSLMAEKAVQRAALAGRKLDYSHSSLGQVEAIMQADWRTIPFGTAQTQSEVEGFIRQWGAYLGEVFRREKGGRWLYKPELPTDRQVYVRFGNQAIFPLEQIRAWVDQRYTPGPVVQAAPEPTNEVKPAPANKAPRGPLTLNPRVLLERYLRRPLKPLESGGLVAALIIGAILLIWALVGLGGAVGRLSRQSYNNRFAELLPQYLLPYQSGPAYSEPAEAGKILVVDLTTRAIADWQYDLPSRVRASSPEDLGLLVQQECRTEQMSGSNAVNEREVCRLAIIDLRNGHKIAERTFYGEEVMQENGSEPVAMIDRQTLVDWTEANYGQ